MYTIISWSYYTFERENWRDCTQITCARTTQRKSVYRRTYICPTCLRATVIRLERNTERATFLFAYDSGYNNYDRRYKMSLTPLRFIVFVLSVVSVASETIEFYPNLPAVSIHTNTWYTRMLRMTYFRMEINVTIGVVTVFRNVRNSVRSRKM